MGLKPRTGMQLWEQDLVEFQPQSIQENGFWHLWSASTAHMNVETNPARVAIPQ